jgi:hypothetical protein
MGAHVRLLTRRFDLSVEGETSQEVDQLLQLLEDRGLSPYAGPGASEARAGLERGATPLTPERDGGASEALPPSSVSTLDSFGGTAAQVAANAEPTIFNVVTKKMGELYILSPKFPPAPDGSERLTDAATVLLGAFDVTEPSGTSGYFLVQALRQTGYSLQRVDKCLNELVQRGLVLVGGVKRGKKYALSEAGRVEARRLATELAAIAGRSPGGSA